MAGLAVHETKGVVRMTEVQKAIQSVERARRLIEEKEKQGSDDYILLECLTDAANGLQMRQSEVETEGGGHSWCYVCGECHGITNYRDSFCRHCGCRLIWDGVTL